MKKIQILIVTALFFCDILQACANEGYSSHLNEYDATHTQWHDLHMLPEALLPLINQAEQGFRQSSGTFSTFKQCLQSEIFPASSQRDAYLAGVVVWRWHTLQHGTQFLSLVKNQAEKKHSTLAVHERPLEIQLELLLESQDTSIFYERLKKYAALFEAVKDMRTGEYTDGCTSGSCKHFSLSPFATNVMITHVMENAQRFHQNNMFLFGNKEQSNKAFMQLFQTVGITDEDLAESAIPALPLTQKVAEDLWQAQHGIIHDDTVCFLSRMKKNPGLVSKMHDPTGYSLLSTALNIHTIQDRYAYIEHLLEGGCECRTEDLQLVVDATVKAIEHQENAYAQISRLTTLYHLLKKYDQHTELRQRIESALASESATSFDEYYVTLVRRAVELKEKK